MAVKESSIINGDSPLPIPRQFARWLGWNEAGILQQLHWHTEQEHGQELDGLRWIRMSETDWMEEIPLDEKAIQRAIVNLGSDGLIMSRTFKGRCKWYAILYSAVAELAGPVDRITQKSANRKKASAARKGFVAKEQNVPIVINPIDTGSSVGYAQVKEQSVPIDEREQSVPIQKEQSVPIVWEQNVPLQEKSQDSSTTTKADLKQIGDLCKEHFFDPAIEPYRADLIKTITKYSAAKVLWAIQIALSPDRQNGKPKSWGYVLGVLEKDGRKLNNRGALTVSPQNKSSPVRSLDPDKAARYEELAAARQKE